MIYLIITIIALSGTGFLWIKGLYKKNKSLQFKLDYAEEEKKSLRNQIREMVELEGEKNSVKKKTKKGKNDIDNVTDEQLAIDYGNKLHNIPTRKRRK